MPAKAQSILRQVGLKPAEGEDLVPVYIPDTWEANTLKAGHTIGTPELLFSTIPAAKIEEWRDAFGGEELRKQKALEAEKAAAKKAAREKEKEKKRLKKEKAAQEKAAQEGAAKSAEGKQEGAPAQATELPIRSAPIDGQAN